MLCNWETAEQIQLTGEVFRNNNHFKYPRSAIDKNGTTDQGVAIRVQAAGSS